MINIEKHKNIMVRILKDIYMDNTLGPILGFKGGTAVLLFYELNRFSVDLDFDLLDPEKEDYVLKRVGEIAQVYGKIKDQAKKHHTIFFELSYDDGGRNLKIEISRRNFGSKFEILNYFGIFMKLSLIHI